MRSLGVVMTISSFRPLVGGGERNAERLAGELVRRGHRVTVLTRQVRPESPSLEDLGGVRVVRLRARDKWGASIKMLGWLLRHRKEVDVVHAQQSSSALVAALAARAAFSAPVVCTPMTNLPELGWAGSHWPGRRTLFRLTSHWIAISEDIQRTLERVAPGCVERIPNGIDTHAFAPASVARRGTPVCLFVARLDHPKRLDIVLEAWSRLAPAAILRVIGDGPLKSQWQRTAPPGVEFLGTREDVAPLLADAEVFLLASDQEGMPVSLLEAMSAGLACVVSAVGAVPEMLSGGAGVAVRGQSAEAFAEALAPVLADVNKRVELGAAARARVVSAYSLAAVGERVEAVYRKVLQSDRWRGGRSSADAVS